MAIHPRTLAIGLARFVTQNVNNELEGEKIAAIVYRLRIVESYKIADVDLICEAMRILTSKLVALPKITFAADVWMPMFTAVSEGGIEPLWSAMMEPIDVSDLANPFLPSESGKLNPISTSPSSKSTSTKCSEQIASFCEEQTLESGLTRRLFAAIWDTDLAETMQKMKERKWNELKIKTDEESANHAKYAFERSVFDVFTNMKDYEMFARELFFASLARILVRFEEEKQENPDEEDPSHFDSCFEVYDDVIKRMWPYLSADEDVKNYTLHIFDRIIELATSEELIQKCAEKFTDTCVWLKMSINQVCSTMEPRLWKVVEALVSRLLELKKSIPYEIVLFLEYSPDEYELHTEPLPPGNKKERFLRYLVDATRNTLLCVLEYLRTSTITDDIVRFMTEFYPELYSSREIAICHAAISLYKESTDRASIEPSDQVLIATSSIGTPAVTSILELLNCSKRTESVACQIVQKTLLQLGIDLSSSEERRHNYVNRLNQLPTFWLEMANYADKKTIQKVARKLARVAAVEHENKASVLATDILLILLKLPIPSEVDPVCNFDFATLGISPETWSLIGDKLVEVNVSNRCENQAVQLFTIRQLQHVDLPMRELIYVVTQMKYLKSSEECVQTHRKFYAKYPEFDEILINFLGREHLVRLCASFLEQFAAIVVTNEKSLIFSLDHENLLDWLRDIGVLDSPVITDKLVEMCRSIEAWDSLMLLQLDIIECSSDDLRTFSRFWKTEVMLKMTGDEQKQIEDEIAAILKVQYEKQSAVMKATREKRYNGRFPNRPKVEAWEQQLLTMHNRIGGHLASRRVHEFADEKSDMFQWLVGVCSGQVSYSKETARDAKRIFARLYPEAEKRNEILYYYGVSAVLYGMGNSQKNGCLTMRHLFLNVYTSMLQSDMKTWTREDALERIDRRMGGFTHWLQDTSMLDADRGLHASIIVRIGDLFSLKRAAIVERHTNDVEALNAELLPIEKYCEVVASRADAIPTWMFPSGQPYYCCAHLRLLIELIFSFPDVVNAFRVPLEKCFSELFGQLFLEDFQEVMIKQKTFIVQTTDKYMSSSLNLQKEYNRTKTINQDVYQVRDIINVFTRFGTAQFHLDALRQIADAFDKLPEKILENLDVLNGTKEMKTQNEKRLLCDVTLFTECLGYVSRLQAKLSTDESVSTNDALLKTFMLLDADAHQKMETSHRHHHHNHSSRHHRHDQLDMSRCTFKTTGNSFVNQHWYNCYTCNMMDSTGVCSTCAVNCHRGHELAYSKKGAFFCDCGEKNCASMQSTVEHVPNAVNALRGQFPDAAAKKTSPKVRQVFPYQFEMVDTNNETGTLHTALSEVRRVFETKHAHIEKILEAVDEANRKALKVADKRRAVVDSLTSAEVCDDIQFMNQLDTSHFLPARRVDTLIQERVAPSKIRELADVIKLDNGTELLVMIPESVQTCLQLHYMDTRTHLFLGMLSMRTETEPIPFHARRLHVSGNRVVACGLYEIYALRFSPQGTVIDRAHIKLSDTSSTSSMQNNPVVKAVFCRDLTKQLVAVASLQYIRIYDLTLSDTNFVEEMVLTTGNVEDIVILNVENGDVRVLVLSTSGYLYEHLITDLSADNNSIFLTNVVNSPGLDVTADGVSLHYSHTFDLVFASFEGANYYARLPAINENYEWKSLNLPNAVHVWKETAGIIGALSTDTITYIHPIAGKILVQKDTLERPILSYFLTTSAKGQAVYAMLLFSDTPTCEVWQTRWDHVHDLWIDDVPNERFAIEMVGPRSAPQPLPSEDLVLMAEQCEPLANIDWTSRDLEQFYTHTELNHRLGIAESMPLTVVQHVHFTLSARITNARQVVRLVRLEVEGVNGPESVRIGNLGFLTATRGPKVFELRLPRDMSISEDNREIVIEVIPKPAQNILKIKSLKLYGCDRAAMDEIQPVFERQPIMTLPNRMVYAAIDFGVGDWAKRVAKRHLSRKFNHPLVCAVSTRTLAKDEPLESLFSTLDTAYLKEWKELAEWDGQFVEMRQNHVEQLINRMEAVRTRWPFFLKTLIADFGTATAFVELMRDEMRKMPLHRCQIMAQAIVKVVFGLLAQRTTEAEQLTKCFLDIFTDERTLHLANDLRSAVQETMSRLEHAIKEERSRKEHGVRLADSEFAAFYGVSRVVDRTDRLVEVLGEQPVGQDNVRWLDEFIGRIMTKLRTDVSTPTLQISDSPSYNLSRVLATCLAFCDPETFGEKFGMLIKVIKYNVDAIYPLTDTSFSNYALLRCVELLLSVCTEKKTEDGRFESMLETIVGELETAGIRKLCFDMLETVIPLWRTRGPATFLRTSTESRRVWLPHVPLVSSSANQPNAVVLNWPSNTDDAYIIACTDLVLLIPQHLQELDRSHTSPLRDDVWIQKLCELASLANGCSAYRQCKKLLLAMCRNDESKYKTMRDKYKMQDLLKQLVDKYMQVSKQVGGHQQLTELVDVLASITKLALLRPDMWRDVCSLYTSWLLRLACYTTDVVASQVVELLIVAVRDSAVGGQLNIQLADNIIETENGVFIEKIIKRFLIGRDETLRWTMHGMLRSVIQLASRQNQCSLVKLLYQEIYPMSRGLGIQGAQLVDLIATYAPRVFSSTELVNMTGAEIANIHTIADRLDSDGFQGMYKLMSELGLGWKAIQFEQNPCLVCFTSKGSHETAKLTAIRSDTRYSANTIIYKLISNYEVSKVTIKLSDVKKSKTIRRVSLYYSAKSVESVDLKLHPELWRKCAVVSVAENETTINLSLVVPVVTSSLIIEFDEVTDVRNTSTQLHCPRCSGPVRSHSGVCEGCGENAFQCMKCRSINYVEKEPFLCQSCGFCKYARIEMFASCRALPGAQHITCDAERVQCVAEMTQLLTKVETTKTVLSGYKALCETLYLKPRPLPTFKLHVENTHVSEYFEKNGKVSVEQLAFQTVTAPVNNVASKIHKHHEELCQQTQQLIYLHEELNRYDNASEVSVVFHKPQNTSYYSTSDSCFGCLCNQLLHSVALLHASCEDDNAVGTILSTPTLIERFGRLSQTYETLRDEIEELLVRLMFGRADTTQRVGELCRRGDVHLSVMVKSLVYSTDPTWQHKLKVVVRHAMSVGDETSCLHALTVLNKYLEATKTVPTEEKRKMRMRVDVAKWLESEEEWNECASTPSTSTADATDGPTPFQWISECLFSQWMTVRAAANQLLVSLSRQQFHEPVALLLLCENLGRLDEKCMLADQFMNAAHTIIDSSTNVKARLFVRQFHVYLIRKIHEECASLHDRPTSLAADNLFGERLRCYVELLTVLLSGSGVENVLLKAGADDLLIFLLHSTIFLKRMMTRRTRPIDSSRMALEKLLRRVSCRDGTKLMEVCVESLKLVKDTSTLGIVVGVMLEIMNPQQETEESFLIQIEKDVAQEDFLQGRMTNNPYNSNDPGLGPLMRDIKNKICRDTEMIALMEDDNGMELLVNGNIISLSLSVRDVYDRLWKRTNVGSPMLIVYRMRGLMGDAVETFIENFGVTEGVGSDEEEDEQLVATCFILTRCGGLDKLMKLLDECGIESSSGRFLLSYLRKILDRIARSSSGRKALVERRLVERAMRVVRKCCADATNESKVQIGVDLYKVIELIVSDKSVHDALCGIAKEDAVWWFELFEKRGNEEGAGVTEVHRKSAQILDQMTASIGNVVLGSDASEDVLVELFPKVLQWATVDSEQEMYHRILMLKGKTIMMSEQLATITSNILQSTQGVRLKQKILDSGVISTTCQYLVKDVPNLYQPTESAEWKTFLARPSLKLILTLLGGLARGHSATQKEIAKTTLKLMHRLEQVASDNSIGTLAENVIDALNEDSEVRDQITAVREETKRKKKQMAMMNRQKQLNKLGMKVGEKGEVKVSARQLHNEPSLDDTDSLACCICRESVIRGDRTSGVYAFAASDTDTGKMGTVSMMVMVHIECHRNAIRGGGGGGGRATDEWSRAKLHNAGAKCNVITPISMGNASSDAWNEAIHRFETDIGRVSGLAHGFVNRNFVFTDMCKLVDCFIYKRSFSTQSEGGGRESNMQYLAVLHLLGVSLPATEAELETSAPNHRLIAFLFTELTAQSWNEQKNDVLRASLNDATTSAGESTWNALRPTLMTWAFVDAYFNKVITITGEDRIEWLRTHFGDTLNKTRTFVDNFDANILPCEDVGEFCDVTGASADDINLFIA